MSAAALLDLIAGHRVTAIIHATAQLGLADRLADGPRTVDALAAATGTHPPSLRRLLRALVALGLCTAAEPDAFALTPTGRFLAADAPQSLKAWALLEGGFLRASWSGLVDSIRTGKTAMALALGDDGAERRFELLGEHADLFNAGMVALTRLVAPAVVAAYDFAGIARLVDVGGGHGELLATILGAHPSMRGAVYDLPQCADGARRRFADAGVAARAEFLPGSFFDSVPSGADALVLKSIVHDWDDERSGAILGHCRRALRDGAKLLLVERLLPETIRPTPADVSVTASDLNMLRGPGGAERTEAEFRALLARSGFRLARVVPAAAFAVLEAVAA